MDAPKKLLTCRRFSVYETEVYGEKGNTLKKEYVAHPGAVVILPLLHGHEVLMIRNERFAVNETLWELPAGTLEIDEPPLETAKRELIEETGYAAGKMTPLATFYSTPGFCNEIMYAFVAEDLSLVGQHLEEGEKITVHALPWPEVLAMMKSGAIKDAKTLTTLLLYRLEMQF